MIKSVNRENRSTRLCKRTNNIKKFHIRSLPPELLTRIFKYLSPRDCCTCSYVCKQWLSITNDPIFWDKLGRSFAGIRKHCQSTTIRCKMDILQIGIFYRYKFLCAIFTRYLQDTRVRNVVSFKNLQMSVFVALFDNKKNCISKKRFKLPETIENCDTEICFMFPSDIVFELLTPFTVEFYLSIPLFPQTIMSPSKTPRQNYLMKSQKIDKFKAKCGCHILNPSNIFTLHTCIPQCIVGLWRKEWTPAFVIYTFTVSDILECLSSFLCPIHRYPAPFCQGRCKYDSERCRITGLMSQPELVPKNMYDAKVLIVFTDSQKHMLCFYTWRAVDIKKGCLELISLSNHSQHVLFDLPVFSKIQSEHLVADVDNLLVVKIKIENPDNSIIWHIAQPTFLQKVPKDRVTKDFEYEGQLYEFEASNARGSIVGTLIKEPADGPPGDIKTQYILVHLRINFQQKVSVSAN